MDGDALGVMLEDVRIEENPLRDMLASRHRGASFLASEGSFEGIKVLSLTTCPIIRLRCIFFVFLLVLPSSLVRLSCKRKILRWRQQGHAT